MAESKKERAGGSRQKVEGGRWTVDCRWLMVQVIGL